MIASLAPRSRIKGQDASGVCQVNAMLTATELKAAMDTARVQVTVLKKQLGRTLTER